MSEERLKIRVDLEGATAIEEGIKSITKTVEGLGDHFKEIAIGAIGIASAWETVKRGFEFNEVTERLTNQLQTITGSLDAARAKLAELRAFARQSPFTGSEVVGGARMLSSITDGKFSDTKALELVGNVAAATGESFESIASHIGRVYAGLQNGDPISRVTRELVRMGAMSGETMHHLNSLEHQSLTSSDAMRELEHAFRNTDGAMERMADTLPVQFKNLKGTVDSLIGGAMEGGMHGLVEAMKALNGWLSNPSTRTGLRELVTMLKEFAIAAGVAFSAVKIAEWWSAFTIGTNSALTAVVHLRLLLSQPIAVSGPIAAMAGITAAIMLGIEAWKLYKAEMVKATSETNLKDAQATASQSVERNLMELQNLGGAKGEAARKALESFRSGINATKGQAVYSGGIGGYGPTGETQQVPDMEARTAAIHAAAEAIRSIRGDVMAKDADPEAVERELRATKESEALFDRLNTAYERAVVSKQRLLEIERDRHLLEVQQSSGDEEDKAIARLQIEATYKAQINKLEEEHQKSVGSQALRDWNERQRLRREDLRLTNDANRAEVEAAQREGELIERNIVLRQQARRIEENRIQGDWRLSDDEKYAARKKALEQDLQDLKDEEALLRDKRSNAPGHAAAYYDTVLQRNQNSQAQVNASLSNLGPDRSTFSGELLANAAELQKHWGNTMRMMADITTNTVTNAVRGLSNAIAGVITGTESAAQAFGQFALSMATQFIASVLEMILMAKVAIPILTALGILSGGATAAQGAAVTAIALATAPAMFKSGGYTGDGPPDEIAGLVHRGEFVIPAHVVDRLGSDNLAAMSRGSSGSSAAGSSGPTINLAVMHDQEAVRRFFDSAEGHNYWVDKMRQTIHLAS